ncbi:MAG: ribosomal L7Ae/L30e/S12e/Gadd45 family protein [Candidatus Nanoarchaeia archaeon]|nr:ribosomal L7Ae/L30e/S12e/Gadd45 family protein [Candidatus Nanoarchaeia archaeon]
MEYEKFDDSISKTIREALEKGNLVIGFKESLKNMVDDKVKMVYIVSNAKSDNLALFEHYVKTGEKRISFLDITNDKLGVVCKKPFNVSCVAILKEE